jgi:UDP-glucose 4-epimerase
MSDVAVIGGNGFIGKALVARLAERGASVTVFDRFSTGIDQSSLPTIRAIQGDFLSSADRALAVEGARTVVHALSTTTPATAQDDPALDVRTNLMPSIDLFTECARAGVERVVFLSTGGAIYGPTASPTLTEDTVPRPVSPYAIGKLAIENYLRFFSATTGLRSTVLRLSNPYGPGQRAGRAQGLIPIALRAVAANKAVTQYGDGSMVRDYIHIDDASRIIADVIVGDPHHEVYNVGSGEGASVADVFRVVEQVTGRPLRIDQRPAPATFVHRSVLDTTRLRAEFMTGPMTSLVDGVRSTWLELMASD